MVEIFSTDRTMSLGCFVNFKAAKGTLSGLADAGILSENRLSWCAATRMTNRNRNMSQLIPAGNGIRHGYPKFSMPSKTGQKDATGNVCAKNTRLRNTASVKGFLTG